MSRLEAGLGSVQVIESEKRFFGDCCSRVGFGETHAPTMRDPSFHVNTTSSFSA
jgi:hypothetical protein